MSSAVKLLLTCVVVTVLFMQFVEPDVAQKPPVAKKLAPNPNVFRGYEDLIRVPRNADGHYWVEIAVHDRPVRFMIDTGASQTTLSQRDALNIGFMPHDLSYDQRVRTANGITRMANVTLRTMAIGSSIELYDVPALVANRGQMSVSLLGMSFLNRLKSFEFRDGQLILKP